MISKFLVSFGVCFLLTFGLVGQAGAKEGINRVQWVCGEEVPGNISIKLKMVSGEDPMCLAFSDIDGEPGNEVIVQYDGGGTLGYPTEIFRIDGGVGFESIFYIIAHDLATERIEKGKPSNLYWYGDSEKPGKWIWKNNTWEYCNC